MAITEYVDVAKAFFPDGKEAKFVNAVLDHMARDIRPEALWLNWLKCQSATSILHQIGSGKAWANVLVSER